jgi:protein-disulfide isomerase
VGDRSVTLGEVDARWRELNATEQLKAQGAVYEGRRRALDVIIGDTLFGRGARARGITVEQLLKQEIPKRIKPVAEADVDAFYKANQDEIQGRPIDDVRAAIVQVLQRERRDDARAALVEDLRKEAGATQIALEPPRQEVTLAPTDPVRGSRTAPVTIVEFSDFQCPFCAREAPVLAKVQATYGDRVRIVWKDFPLEDIHPRAMELAEGARCAGDQGKYWEFHDRVFSAHATVETAPLEDYARAIGIPAPQFMKCVSAKRHTDKILESQDAGHRLGVDATPTLFINGRAIAGAQPFEVLARVIDDELARGVH